MAQNVYISRHPLLLHKLARLRDQATDPNAFRALVREMARLLFYEATQDLKLASLTVRTPLAECTAHEISGTIGLIPILRAGLGMAEALLDMVPNACVWHLGLYRDHDTCQPVIYYNKLPSPANLDLAIVVDPMLATGGSATEAISILKRVGVSQIKFMALIAAPEGVARLQGAHPDVPIYLAALDSHLNARNYIVPGLGDAGDRQFGTA
ncbi:MAG: uracil phosphoribosyltransferase [Verrucomicrobia bacterium]|nr:uracil phosphoribosyltransferase [Verrucomicrobiota bacterium]